MSCKACGKCCEVIPLTLNPLEIEKEAKKTAGMGITDVEFANKHWHPMTYQEAIKKNPIAKKAITLSRRVGERITFYSCDCYDKQNGICTVHNENKPSTCKKYPLYYFGKLHEGHLFITSDCGYDTPEYRWWEKTTEIKEGEAVVKVDDKVIGEVKSLKIKENHG